MGHTGYGASEWCHGSAGRVPGDRHDPVSFPRRGCRPAALSVVAAGLAVAGCASGGGQATSRIWVAAADGAGTRRPAAAGPGALDPVWGRAGAVLFVRADWLWLLPAGATAPTRLAGPLGALAAPAYNLSYYGYVPYPQLIAWAGARPFATASNG